MTKKELDEILKIKKIGLHFSRDNLMLWLNQHQGEFRDHIVIVVDIKDCWRATNANCIKNNTINWECINRNMKWIANFLKKAPAKEWLWVRGDEAVYIVENENKLTELIKYFEGNNFEAWILALKDEVVNAATVLKAIRIFKQNKHNLPTTTVLKKYSGKDILEFYHFKG